jgi:hypothetical protein
VDIISSEGKVWGAHLADEDIGITAFYLAHAVPPFSLEPFPGAPASNTCGLPLK